MAIGKKGVFFTVLSILIVGILLVMFRPNPGDVMKDRLEVEQARVRLASQMIDNINEAYMPRVMVVGTYRALNAMVLYINFTGKYFNQTELNSIFEEVLVTGNLSGVPIDTIIGQPMMDGYSVRNSLIALEHDTRYWLSMDVEFNLTHFDAVLYQSNSTGYEFIGANLSMRYEVDAGVATWRVDNNWSALVPVQGLYDPLYMKEQEKGIPVNITKAAINYVADWTSLYNFILNTNYVREPNAPSFLMRLTGNLSGSNCCGLESAINPVMLGLREQYNATYIDYFFYSRRCAPHTSDSSLYKLKHIYNDTVGNNFYGFLLDAPHYVKFGQGNSTSANYTPTSGPDIMSFRCEINVSGNWQDCSNAQWNTTIMQVRAYVNHSISPSYLKNVSFELMNRYDGTLFFTGSVSVQSPAGVFTYNNPDIVINDSGGWRLNATARDNLSRRDSGHVGWFVPWGIANITYWDCGETYLCANVTCYGGECGNVTIELIPS
jgi:hypothetical protein